MSAGVPTAVVLQIALRNALSMTQIALGKPYGALSQTAPRCWTNSPRLSTSAPILAIINAQHVGIQPS
jgi:hypothetical protein